MISGIDDILAGYESPRAGQEALYKDLLQHPELYSRRSTRPRHPIHSDQSEGASCAR